MSDDSSPSWPRGVPRRPFRTLVVAMATILLVGLSLRIPTISLSPLVPRMIEDTGHGETFLSLLTSIPLALTLLAAPVAPMLANRLGRSRTVGFALIAIVAGMVVRSVPGDVTLLVGTGLLGFSIAIVTVLVPSIISAERASIRSRLTGIYSMSLSLGPALALGLTIPIGELAGLDWRGTLLTWIVISAGALALWLVYARGPRATASTSETPTSTTPTEATPTSARADTEPPSRSDYGAKAVLADSNVWLLALFLGVTSLMFYTTSAWLPTVFAMDGMSAQTAGGYVSLISIIAIPLGLIAPAALRTVASRLIAPAAPVLATLGLVLLLVIGSSAALPTTILLGISQGLCLGASYDQIIRFGRSPAHTAAVSAVTSAVGVALAAVGPLVFGIGLETTSSAAIPMIGLAAIAVVQTLIGTRTSRL